MADSPMGIRFIILFFSTIKKALLSVILCRLSFNKIEFKFDKLFYYTLMDNSVYFEFYFLKFLELYEAVIIVVMCEIRNFMKF